MNVEQKKKEGDTLIAPRAAMLGICDRARFVRGNHPLLWHFDLLGLRRSIPVYIYPFDMSNLHLAVAVYGLEDSDPGTIILRDKDGAEIFRVDVSTTRLESTSEGATESIVAKAGNLIPVDGPPSWTMLTVPLEDVIITEPQIVQAFLASETEEIPLGDVGFGLAESPPLTPDRIKAIKSDPRSIKTVRMRLGCKHCPSKLTIVVALEKPEKKEQGAMWYQDVPEFFNCACGKTHMPLEIIRANGHALLGLTNMNSKNLSYSAQYEQKTIDRIIKDFADLLKISPEEKLVQQFLSRNPIMFHFLSPLRIFEKPEVLNKHIGDFAILDSRGTLIFVEIERPGILVVRKDGSTGADMVHAISQVRDWLFQYTKHRSAVLDCLTIGVDEVTKVKGLVIAGRDQGYDSEHLRKFKWQDLGPIECITYDDLLNACVTLGRGIQEI